MSSTLGLAVSSERIAKPAPLPFMGPKWDLAKEAKCSHRDSSPLPDIRLKTTRLRSGSYLSRILAWAKASAEPYFPLTTHAAGWVGLPSILIGRPSQLVTRRPWATPPS